MPRADPVWHAIDAELDRRKAKHLAPSSWAALGRLLPKASSQVLTNWKARGVPPKEYANIATALGWSVDRLLGKEDVRDESTRPKRPARNYEDRREVSESDWILLQAVKVATTEQERETILKRHEELLAQARAHIDAAK